MIYLDCHCNIQFQLKSLIPDKIKYISYPYLKSIEIITELSSMHENILHIKQAIVINYNDVQFTQHTVQYVRRFWYDAIRI